jgi:integrase
VPGKAASKKWAEDRAKALLLEGKPQKQQREVPTLKEFAPRFMEGYARANQQKPSGIAANEAILRHHLGPILGDKRLNEITTEDVQRLKGSLKGKAPKTVNNVLTVLNMILKTAVEWKEIEEHPCSIKWVRVIRREMRFHDFPDFERLVATAQQSNVCHLIVLLGGEAGLRCGEMMALEWSDIDFTARQICVARSEWKGHVTPPKGGRIRYVPLTRRLGESLRDARHARSKRVLCDERGQSLTQKVVQGIVRRAARNVGVPSGVHILRHTFCSHLAMRGAPASAIQKLAGHQDLATTMRYMHLSPASLDSAIRLLEERGPVRGA